MANSKRKCRGCKKFYPPEDGRTVGPCFYCSIDCQMGFLKSPSGEAAVKKVANKNVREAKKKLLTKGQLAAKAQYEFNRYIRIRDKSLPCISCCSYDVVQWHAGHYKTVGSSPELRFNVFNVHKQCSQCNDHGSGNITNYRVHLIEKLGLEKVECIESKHEAKRYTKEQLIRIRDIFRRKANLYEAKFR